MPIELLIFGCVIYAIISGCIMLGLVVNGEDAEEVMGYGVFWPLWLIKKTLFGGFKILFK